MRRIILVLTTAFIVAATIAITATAAVAAPPPTALVGLCTAHHSAPEFAQGHPHIFGEEECEQAG